MSAGRYPMKLVSQRTGLSPHVLRVWERRYAAVKPDRTDTNRRIYDEKELRRLELMAILTRAGHAIGQIAKLSAAELDSLAGDLPAEEAVKEPRSASTEEGAGIDEAWGCVVGMDLPALRRTLDKAAVSMGIAVMTEQLIVPLVERIGIGWEEGEISVAEEHAASAVIKEMLFMVSRPYAKSAGAPGLLVTTPSGQLHELGGILVSSAARSQGWEVAYLGPSLPAEEIARAAVRSQVLAVALSIVYPADDPLLPDEIRRLRRSLPDEVALLVGGRSVGAYQAVMKEVGATVITNLAGLRLALDQLRAARLE